MSLIVSILAALFVVYLVGLNITLYIFSKKDGLTEQWSAYTLEKHLYLIKLLYTRKDYEIENFMRWYLSDEFDKNMFFDQEPFDPRTWGKTKIEEFKEYEEFNQSINHLKDIIENNRWEEIRGTTND